MFKTRFIVFLVIGAVLALGIVATQDIASAKSLAVKKCDSAWKSCHDRCSRVFENADRVNACHNRCIDKLATCYIKNPDKKAQSATTSTPPKPKYPRNPMNVGPIRQPGSGGSSTPTSKVGQNVGKVGGVKQDWSSTSTSGGTQTIQRSRGKER